MNGLEPRLLHEINALTEPRRFGGIVRDKEDGSADEGLESEFLHRRAGSGIERRERLVEQRDGPIFHQCARERRALAHAARQCRGALSRM